MPSLRCLFLAFSVLVSPSFASAEPTPSGNHREMRLSWVRSAAAASCPDAGHVEADVEQRLGWSPFVRPNVASESIEASVTRDNDVWRAAIELRDADGSSLGSRTVESPAATCASLSAAAGLAIALMIEPLLPEKPAPVAPPIALPKPVVVPTIPPADSASTVRTDQHLGARGNLAIGAVASTGILPRASVGITLAGSTRLFDRLFGSVSASFLPEEHVRSEHTNVGFGMTLGSIGPCYRIPIREAWSFSSCVSLLVGSLQIAVTDPAPVSPGARLWWGASTGLRLGWNAGSFETALGIDALAHFTRHSYVIDHIAPLSSAASFVEPAVALMESLVLGVHY